MTFVRIVLIRRLPETMRGPDWFPPPADQDVQPVPRRDDERPVTISEVAAPQLAERGRGIAGRSVPAQLHDASRPGGPKHAVAAEQPAAERGQRIGPGDAVAPVRDPLAGRGVEGAQPGVEATQGANHPTPDDAEQVG